jgi:hypothetical protein
VESNSSGAKQQVRSGGTLHMLPQSPNSVSEFNIINLTGAGM